MNGGCGSRFRKLQDGLRGVRSASNHEHRHLLKVMMQGFKGEQSARRIRETLTCKLMGRPSCWGVAGEVDGPRSVSCSLLIYNAGDGTEWMRSGLLMGVLMQLTLDPILLY
jgi:hypothetical protein